MNEKDAKQLEVLEKFVDDAEMPQERKNKCYFALGYLESRLEALNDISK